MCAHPPVYKWGWGHTLHFYLDKYTVKMLLQVGHYLHTWYLLPNPKVVTGTRCGGDSVLLVIATSRSVMFR